MQPSKTMGKSYEQLAPYRRIRSVVYESLITNIRVFVAIGFFCAINVNKTSEQRTATELNC